MNMDIAIDQVQRIKMYLHVFSNEDDDSKVVLLRKSEQMITFLDDLLYRIEDGLKRRFIHPFTDDESKFITEGKGLFDPLVLSVFPGASQE